MASTFTASVYYFDKKVLYTAKTFGRFVLMKIIGDIILLIKTQKIMLESHITFQFKLQQTGII